MAHWSKESVLHFIRAYRSTECLWNTECKEYHNKYLKDKAYDKLIQVCKKFDPQTNRDTITRKINNLRSSFRRELKKKELSLSSGPDTNEVYEPKLWYFDDLAFLSDLETSNLKCQNVRPLQQGGSRNNESQPESDTNYMMDASRHEYTIGNDRIKDDDHEYEQPLNPPALIDTDKSNYKNPTAYHTSQPQQSSREQGGRKRKRDSEHRHAEDERPMVEYNGLTTNVPKSDKFDIFGHYVSHSLRQMSAEQYIHTQKLIADALYEGQLGNLSRRSRLLADPE